MKKVNVLLPDRRYSILIGGNIFIGIEGMLLKHDIPEKIAAVVDRNILKFHRKKLDILLKSKKYSVELFPFAATEKNKNLYTVEKIYSFLQKGNYGRDNAIIAVGGGITGDVAAFAASTYMRGIKYVHVPTTLLSAVDSSVGGKTGVNFKGIKNFIGTFYQPEFVLIDTSFFSTLPQNEILCGLGEAVKTAFLAGEKYSTNLSGTFHNILKDDLSDIDNLVYDSVRFKAGVVSEDEKEEGLRKILNFGHTFAHALETVSGFGIKHGQAVIFGIVCALNLSLRMKLINRKDFDDGIFLTDLIKDKVIIPDVEAAALYNLMQADKKNRNGKIKFILIKSRGNVFVDVEAGRPDVLASIDAAFRYFYSATVL
jgi:3-dehydroquinate synthase